jgi:hypothetical protein
VQRMFRRDEAIQGVVKKGIEIKQSESRGEEDVSKEELKSKDAISLEVAVDMEKKKERRKDAKIEKQNERCRWLGDAVMGAIANDAADAPRNNEKKDVETVETSYTAEEWSDEDVWNSTQEIDSDQRFKGKQATS